jgi:hypothetical protein
MSTDKLFILGWTAFGIAAVAGLTMMILAGVENSNRWNTECLRAGKSIVGNNCIGVNK